MRYVILLTLFVLILSEAQSSSSNFTLQETNELEDSEHKTQFMDLNLDCQMLILEQLRIVDLISLSKANKYVSNLADDILRRKFSKKNVVFSMYIIYTSYFFEFEETDDKIKVAYAKTAAEILKKFGASIRNLEIQHMSKSKFLDQKPIEKVYKLIQEHCAESLTQLHFFWMLENFFDYITMPFKNVHTVSLFGELAALGNGQLNFQQIFPSLRSLRMNNIRNGNISTLELEFPYLEHLEVVRSDYYRHECLTVPIAMRLIRLNSHIQSIVLGKIDEEMLQFASNHLPKLEQLTIFNYKEDRATAMHFEHVKRLKIVDCEEQSVPSRISFGENLEEFEFKAYPQDRKYTDFIVNNQKLKIIRNVGNFGLDNNDIERLALADLEVVEMSLNYRLGLEVANYMKLIENCKQLEQLHLNMLVTPISRLRDIALEVQAQLPNEWILNVDYEKYQIFIIRKYHV